MAKGRTFLAADGSPRPYHHGALREALLASAERILARDGMVGLTLRAAAREAGATHAAPKNHFGDLTGLLSELAAVGFDRFAAFMLAAASDKDTAGERLNAIGRAYVEFALAEPGLFQLMFRGERLDETRPALREAMGRAYRVLTEAVAAAHPASRPADEAPAPQVARAWSMVHGFAMLLLDNRLNAVFGVPPSTAEALTLLDAMLALD